MKIDTFQEHLQGLPDSKSLPLRVLIDLAAKVTLETGNGKPTKWTFQFDDGGGWYVVVDMLQRDITYLTALNQLAKVYPNTTNSILGKVFREWT